MEHLVVGQVRATDVVAVEEDRQVGQALVDPRQLAGIAVVVQQVLELVGEDTLVELRAVVAVVAVGPALGAVTHAVDPVERVDGHHVHAGAVDEVGGEVARGVRRHRAVVHRSSWRLKTIDTRESRRRVVRVGGPHESEVRLIDREDLVRQLGTEIVNLLLGDHVVGGRVVGARRELVVGVPVGLGVHAVDARGRGTVQWRTRRDIDVHGSAVVGGRGTGVHPRELLLVGPSRRAVVDVEGDRGVARPAR